MDLSEINGDERFDAVQAHRQLAALYYFTIAQEQDNFSLAQPSPLQFIPSYATNGTALPVEGE